jgi:hypothetical protein
MKRETNIIVIVTLAVAAGFFIWLAKAAGAPLSALLHHITIKLYPFRNENFFIVNKVRGRDIFTYAYFMIIASSIIALFVKDFLIKRPVQKKIKTAAAKEGTPHTVIVAALAVFFLMAGLQLVYQIGYFTKEIKDYSGKTEPERLTLAMGAPYDFARFCREHLPGSARGQYASDLNVETAGGLSTRYRVAYHAFPINITIPTDESIGAYVVFQKQDPHAAVPPGFNSRYVFDEFSLIAIKDKE